MSPQKGTISIGNTSSNHHCSGDMLVFRGVIQKIEAPLLPATKWSHDVIFFKLELNTTFQFLIILEFPPTSARNPLRKIPLQRVSCRCLFWGRKIIHGSSAHRYNMAFKWLDLIRRLFRSYVLKWKQKS